MPQLGGLANHVALQDRRVVPRRIFEGRGHDVLGLAVQPVRKGAGPGWPPRGEELIAAPAQQHGLGFQRLVKHDHGPLCAIVVPDLAEPAAALEALLTGRVLDDSVERDVLADDDLSHVGSPLLVSSATTDAGPAAPGNWAVAGRPVRPPAGVRIKM